jgi:hypothetical protein
MLTWFSLARVGPLSVFRLMVPESACLPVPSKVTLLAGMLLGAGWQQAGNALRIPAPLLGAATVGALLLRTRNSKR